MSKPQKKLQKEEERPIDPKMKALRDKDRELVRGKFIFHEVPNGRLEFVFRKWPGDQVQKYDMYDGQIYTIPLAVAVHLNQECKYPIHSFTMDENNKPSIKVGQWIRRCSFQSLEFIDTPELQPIGIGANTIKE